MAHTLSRRLLHASLVVLIVVSVMRWAANSPRVMGSVPTLTGSSVRRNYSNKVIDTTNMPSIDVLRKRSEALREFQDIIRVNQSNGGGVFIFTIADAYATQQGIGCVDADSGTWKWHRQALARGRYNLIRAGESTVAECTGYPVENYFGIRSIVDGRILGRPWKVGRATDFAVSGRRVAVVSGVEAPIVRVFNEHGQVVRSLSVPNAERLIGFPRGFAIVVKNKTIIIDQRGRRLGILQ